MRTIASWLVAGLIAVGGGGVAALNVVGCGSSSVAASGACFKTSDCEAGLECLPLTVAGTSGSCTALETKICTKSCTGDADCAGLRDALNQGGYKCDVCPPQTSFCAQFQK
jgi:hypothetical protein